MSDNDQARPAPSWSTATGRTDIKPAVERSTSDEALDRVLIADRIYRYGFAFDERRLDQLVEGFTEDGLWEGSIMGIDQVGPFHGREKIRGFMAEFFPIQKDQRRHVFTNVIIDELDGDTANAYAYLVLWSSQNAETHAVTAGPYRFALRRDDRGVWLISELHGGWDSPFG